MVSRPIQAIVRSTVFRQFTAGEHLDEVRVVAGQLATSGVKCIVDHSTEESEQAFARQDNLNSKIALLNLLRNELSAACAFMPVKLTALVSPSLLEKLAAAERKDGAVPSSRDAASALNEAAQFLDASERDELSSSLGSLRALCESARSACIPLLFDAEQVTALAPCK